MRRKASPRSVAPACSASSSCWYTRPTTEAITRLLTKNTITNWLTRRATRADIDDSIQPASSGAKRESRPASGLQRSRQRASSVQHSEQMAPP